MAPLSDSPCPPADPTVGEPRRSGTEPDLDATGGPAEGETFARHPGEPPVSPSVAEVAAALAVTGEGAVEGARIATLLLSDLVGSSALVERTGDAASAELFQKHDRLARDLLEEHSGLEIDKTDGFLLLFDRPWQAVLYALDYHWALAELSQVEGIELESRIGIHLGEIVLHRNPPHDVARGAKPLEVEGLAKPTAARLMSVAGGRQTLMTQAAFDLARRSAVGSAGGAESLRWLAHGSYNFKGVEEPVEVFEVGVEGFAPLTAPESSEKVARVADEDTILGWRPAPDLEIPHRPRWVVVEKLGEGGFGEVWLGEYRKTGERRVFKFCYEAERLLSLQREITVFRLLKEELGLRHDIARILDWNFDEAPYFIEFVYIESGSLVGWAEGQGGIGEVPITDRLEIVAQAATALAAAHSVGVLHKDVTPAHVLIESDAKGRPRAVLTDFGIGLVTDRERLVSKGITVLGMTELEVADSATGTQLYMAPELLAGKAPTIQADLYALGVMLYQMVVGDLGRPLAQGWQRRVEDKLLREDIAALVDGSPARRPGNAAEVAERLRTLEQRRAARAAEEQAARAAERAQRRRKVLTIVAAVSSIFLVVVSFLAIQAMRARADAEHARADAERRRGQAEQLIDFMLNDLHEGLDKIGRLDLLESVARTSQEYFDSLSERDESPDDLSKRGLTLLNIGDVLLDQGDAEAALATQRSALALFEAAVARDPGCTDWQQGLGLSRMRLGKVLMKQGDNKAALAAYRAALATMEELAARESENRDHRFGIARAQYEIAWIEGEMGAETVLDSLRHAVRLAEGLTAGAGEFAWRHWELLLEARIHLGNMLRFRSELAAAAEEYRTAELLAQRLVVEDPANVTWNRRLAWLYYQIGALQYKEGDFPAALGSFGESRALYELLIQIDPIRVDSYAQLAESLRMAGKTQNMLGQPEAALVLYRQALPLLERLLADDPTRLTRLDYLAALHYSMGSAHLQLEDTASALESYEASLSLRGRILETSGSELRAQHEFAETLLIIGNVLSARNEWDQARQKWRRALELVEPVTAQSRQTYFLDTHAKALLQLDRIDEARPIVEELLAQGWKNAVFLDLLRQKRLADAPQKVREEQS